MSRSAPESVRMAFNDWPVEEADLEVHVLCSPVTGCMCLSEADMLQGRGHLAALLDPLQAFPIAIAFLISGDLNNNRDDVQLLCAEMGVRPFPCLSLEQAAQAAQRMLKIRGHNEMPSEKGSAERPPVAALSHVPNLNKKRANALLEKFGSLENVSNSASSDLSKVNGIGNKASSSVETFFNKDLKS